MVSCFISRLVILIFGTLYPAYASYKAVRTKNVKEYVKWMMYWIVFALFTCAETFTDLFFSFWFPFYYEIKIITVIYLLSPATKGSSILYRKFVHPVLIKREHEIDEYISKAKEQGYHTMLNLGSKGVTYATSLIMQTAIKGGGGLVNQLKKSYSLSDLSEEQSSRRQKLQSEDDVDSQYEEDSRVLRRMTSNTARRTISSANQANLYFPEIDTYQRPMAPDEEQFHSQVHSSEEVSSGYSSGDPFYCGIQRPRDHLVRTGSLGATSRIRTRAITKAGGLPKRSSLSEVGSTWSATEPHESQIEPDEYYNFPLSHSVSLPYPFESLRFMRPEYQNMMGNIANRQMFMFINNSPFFYPAGFENNSADDINEPAQASPLIISDVEKKDIDNPELNISENDPSVQRSPVDNEKSIEHAKDKAAKDKNEDQIKDNSNDSVTDRLHKNTVDQETPNAKELSGAKEKSQERFGKYNKKPAPDPPADNNLSKSESVSTLEDDESLAFSTPDSSPKLERKLTTSKNIPTVEIVGDCDNDKVQSQEQNTNLLEVPKKGKKKEKMSKKIRLPKMSFSFWSHKSGKHSSGSESSIASVEIAPPKNDTKNDDECFISLKGEENDNNGKETENQK